MIGINVVVNSKTMKTTWTSSQKFCEGRQKYVISNLKMEILNVSFLLISKSYSYVLKNSILMAKILDSVELAHEELTHD